MRIRTICPLCLMAVVLAAASLALAPVWAQGQSTASEDAWVPPRTPDGQPDLQGVWANNNATPLERPEALAERKLLTDEELAALRARAGDLFSGAGDAAFGDSVFKAALADAKGFTSSDKATGNYNQFWLVDRVWDNRTSLIVDPPNGTIPPLTPNGQARVDARSERRQRPAHGPEDRSLGERCLSFGAPRLGAGYNNYYQLFQSADYVVIHVEMGHDARIIPLDGRGHIDQGIRQWLGNSRGHWDEDTLVVETTNYSPNAYLRGATENLRVIERFTRVDPNTLQYEVTLEDPTTWTAPWTVMIPLQRSKDAIFEYACHEGNIGMDGILSGARTEDKANAEATRTSFR